MYKICNNKYFFGVAMINILLGSHIQMDWFVSKISLFQRIHIIYDGFSREKIGIVKFNIVLKIYAKNTWKYVIFFLQN